MKVFWFALMAGWMMLHALPLPAAGGGGGADSAGQVSLVCFEFSDSGRNVSGPQALVSLGESGSIGTLFWWREDANTARVGVDSVREGLILSKPFFCSAGSQRVELALPRSEQAPALPAWFIRVNGADRVAVSTSAGLRRAPWTLARNLGVQNHVPDRWALGPIKVAEAAWTEALDALAKIPVREYVLGAKGDAGGFQVSLRGDKPFPGTATLVEIGSSGSRDRVVWRAENPQAPTLHGIFGNRETTEGFSIPVAVKGTNELVVGFPRLATPAALREAVLAFDFLSKYTYVIWNGELAYWAPFRTAALAAQVPVAFPSLPPMADTEGSWFVPHDFHALTEVQSLRALQNAWFRQGSFAAQMGYCGGLELELEIPLAPAQQGLPLFAGGETGRADLVYLVWSDEKTARIGFDHWGLAPSLGEAFSLPPGRHRIRLVVGSLVPAEAVAGRVALPGEAAWRGWVKVWVDDRLVYRRKHELYPSAPDTHWLGVNVAGSSSCVGLFPGLFISVTPWWPVEGP